MMSVISDNLHCVQEQIEAAALRSGRKLEDIQLVAVSKTHSPEAVREAFGAGQRIFGENRIQEAESKIAALPDLEAEWHLIGHLQTNKIKKALPIFHLIHSADSVKLLEGLEMECAKEEIHVSILLQLNLAGETSKFGAGEGELELLLNTLVKSSHLRCRGLMIIPPFEENLENVRPYFRRLRELGEKYHGDLAGPQGKLELSMGMSHDYPVAIEEGATLVRVGTAIFGNRFYA